MKAFTIGQVAKLTGLSIESIRFYEREKLIAAPFRQLSGYRQYSIENINELLFVTKAKQFGFTLNEIKELLFLRSNTKKKSADVKNITTTKIKEIDQKIEILQSLRNELVKLADSCDGKGSVCECPIMDALQPQQKEIIRKEIYDTRFQLPSP